MAKGKFRLYYKDSTGLEVPLGDVKYRILQLPDNVPLAEGVTAADGSTLQVDAAAVGALPGLKALETVAASRPRPTPLLPASTSRFRLQVWDYEQRRYVSPDLHPRQGADTLDIDAGFGYGMVERKLRLRPYFRIRFFKQVDNGPIANAPYVAYTRDRQGRQLVATDLAGKAIKGNTFKNGQTVRVEHEGPLEFHFDLPGTTIKRKTDVLSPLVRGRRLVLYTLAMKTQQAMTAAGEGALVRLDGKTSAPAVLNAEREELLLLTPEVWKEFEAVSGQIENTMAGMHRARANLARALEARSAEDVKRAEQELGLAEDAVAEMLNKDFGKLADLQEVVTFESYDKGRTVGNGGARDRVGLRRRYIPKTKYEELKRRRIKGVPINVELGVNIRAKAGKASAGGKAKHDPLGKEAFDEKKFLDSLRDITLQAKQNWRGDTKVLDLLELGGNQFSETVKKSESYQVESSAQWLRFVAGAGASAEANWNPRKGKVRAQLQGSAEAKLVLFEGKWVHSYAIPSARGWQMHFAGEDLGAIVFVVSCELYGFAGAKGSLAGCVGVAYEGGKAKITAQARDRDDSLARNFDAKRGLPRAPLGDGRRVVPAALNEKPPSDLNGMSVSAEVFAGVEGGLKPSGELKWLPPNQRQPVSFAALSLDVAVNGGIGASAQLHIYYAQGKFRIKAAARLCWGVGAKGALDFVVDAGGMLEFVKWVHHQLKNVGFRVLLYIAEPAFMALSQLLFMLIDDDSAIGKQLAVDVVAVREAFDRMKRRLELAGARERLAARINKVPTWLIYATPETRGMLLYELTRHSAESHVREFPSASMPDGDLQVHHLESHKQAILKIMAPVFTVAEWQNTMQHMTPRGQKRPDPGKAEGDVIRFLDYGWSLNHDLDQVFAMMNSVPQWKPKDVGSSYLQKFLEQRSKLRDRFPKGYEVAQFGTPEYDELLAVNEAEAPTFAMIDPDALWLDRDEPGTMLA